MRSAISFRLLFRQAVLLSGLVVGNTTPQLAQTAPSRPASATRAISPAVDFIIIPGERVGPIRANTSEAELVRLLGKSVVTAGDVLPGAEGEEITGTTLYKGTADEVQIFYKDAKRTRPETVSISPQFLDGEGNPRKNLTPSRWATTDGLRIGMTLKELEQRNGKPFKLYGFAWDYSGTISNWQGGKLTSAPKKPFVAMTLGPPVSLTPAQDKAYNKCMGDGEFLSSGAAMQLLNPIVVSITTSF